MQSRYYDTSSSIYPDDRRTQFYNNLYKTPSPLSPVGSNWSSSSEDFSDDVYRPYVTPPSPFEKSTQYNSNKVTAVNPYAQSLWYSFRGNDGSEIEKYKKVTTEKLMPSLMEKSSENLQLGTGRVSGNYSMGSIRSQSRSHREQRFTATSSEEQILEPLNNPPPYELISIQSIIVKKLKLLLEISNKFDKFVDENNVLINSKIKLFLFSNIKTLLIIHHKFLDTILNRDGKIDLEELLYDHLQRLYHVYPSYLCYNIIRVEFVRRILDTPKFNPFVKSSEALQSGDYFFSSTDNDSHCSKEKKFHNLLVSPSVDFERFLRYLDDYIGKSSPRIGVLISKFLGHYENLQQKHLDVDANEPLYLEIPQEWKASHKMNWKEISGMTIDRQLVHYLRWQIKSQYQRYCKIMKLMRCQVEQISKISVLNNHISKGFVRLQSDLPHTARNVGTKYQKHLGKVDVENKRIYCIVEEFGKFINSESLKSADQIMVNVLAAIKKLNGQGNQGNGNCSVEKVFRVHQLKVLFEESMYLVVAKFVVFVRRYLRIKKESFAHSGMSVVPVESIVSGFQRSRLQQQESVQRQEAQLAVYNQELGHACAKGRLLKRFFA